MDSKEHVAPSSSGNTLSTTAQEAQSNQHGMCYMPTLKIDLKEEITAEFIDEEELPCSDYMYPYKPSEPSKYVNYYDSKDYVIKLKNVFPENECPQLNSSKNSKIVSEDTELLSHINKGIVKIENTEEEFSLNLKEEHEDTLYQFTINTERLDEHDLLDDTPSTASIHYDVLVTPREVQCNFCNRIFKNNFNFLKHNIEHMRIEMKTPGYKKINELHQFQYCYEGFNNHDSMLAHDDDVHRKKQPKVGLCEKQSKSVSNRNKLKKSVNQVTENGNKCKYCNAEYKFLKSLKTHMKLCRTGKRDEKKKYKCDSCELVCVSAKSLSIHTKRNHYDYGRMFDCWCGEQFRSPTILREHKNFRHGNNTKEKLFKCKSCEVVFVTKSSLKVHVKSLHYDYGRMFDCWCGKQFRTPIHLRKHKSRVHDDKFKGKNKEKLRCADCQKIFKTKKYLARHKRNFHSVKLFHCWCGEQFNTQILLFEHQSLRHNSNGEDELCEIKYCEEVRHSDTSLKMFECWCGKQFPSSTHLYEHKRQQHLASFGRFQCGFCHKFFNHKSYLTLHVKNAHNDHGKVFECRCEKQFRTLLNLKEHWNEKHALVYGSYDFHFGE